MNNLKKTKKLSNKNNFIYNYSCSIISLAIFLSSEFEFLKSLLIIYSQSNLNSLYRQYKAFLKSNKSFCFIDLLIFSIISK